MSAARHRWRKIFNLVMLTCTGLCALLAVGAMVAILGFLVWKGAGALNWDFFTNLPAPVGVPGGGMANAIVGTGKLLLLASAIGLPIGFLAGVYLAEFGSRPSAFVIRYVTDLLNGVPSIVIGIFAYAVVVLPMRTFSTLAGGFALGVMMIPIAVRGTEESLRTVPPGLREASEALGASRTTTVVRVVVPAAFRAVLTGMMLALARVAGETAPLLFTAFGNNDWSPGWTHAIASLPVMIYNYAISPFRDWHRQAWAAGLVLLGLVLLANIAAKLLIGRAAEAEH
jgi:phosphate transport system permease protein